MKRVFFILLSGIAFYSLVSCQFKGRENDRPAGPDTGDLIPVLSPEASMKSMRLEKGFSVKLVAAEPLVSTPVAMAFDDAGRIWVVEMMDYQPVVEDDDGGLPSGKVVILEDRDGDGIMDSREVFLDSLSLPRAICLAYGGLLLAAPPDLWFIEISNGHPGKRVLIDSAYTVTDNMEGQTNGLLRAVDNWIYSAGFGSDKRYRRMNGQWYTERTFLRGQWGIAQDDYGRLFYNNNSRNLLGDYFLPGLTAGNVNQEKVAGFNENIVKDNRVYPAGPTPAVNRGYMEGVLDDSLRLKEFTAGCGPLVYRGGLFPSAYRGNAFVCEPAANLIKRDILNDGDDTVSGKQAYQGKEFLSSTDRRFRPVSLYDGPDGALYVVDMYRGVIQDAMFITDYLKQYSLKNGLNKPLTCGRIYKIVPDGKETVPTGIPDDPGMLAALLENKNGWVRDHAQQKIIDRQYKASVPALEELLENSPSAITRIHAFRTLEGLGAMTKHDISCFLNSPDPRLQKQALAALIPLLNENNYREYIPEIKRLAAGKDTSLAPYIAYLTNKISKLSLPVSGSLQEQLLDAFPENRYVADAIIAGIEGREKAYADRFEKAPLFHQRLNQVLKNVKDKKDMTGLDVLKSKYPRGFSVYQGTCQSCHGAAGKGIEFVAPPLDGSDIVLGDKDKLIPIVLYGLTGTVKVNGKEYDSTMTVGEMPGFGSGQFTDKALQEVVSFIRAAWSNKADPVAIEDIYSIRKQYKGRKKPFAVEELPGGG